ncbi:MAG: S9 family peptidase, partial [Acidobacteriota bacterium]|nr:S9 family peptidase [Acidobacteriota bacterium]
MKNVMRPLVAISIVAAMLASGVLAQNGTIVPTDNLVVEGLPAIPASLADGVGRYTEFRGASISSWHPTRREMLISTRFGETNQVHLLKMPGGARTQLTFSRERAGGASYRPKTGEFFIFNRDVGGNEFFQYYRYDRADGTTTLLTDGKSRNTGWNWSNAGDRAVYMSTRRNGKDTDLYIINPSDPKSDRLLLQLEGGGWDVTDWSPDDSKLLLIEGVSINESY